MLICIFTQNPNTDKKSSRYENNKYIITKFQQKIYLISLLFQQIYQTMSQEENKPITKCINTEENISAEEYTQKKKPTIPNESQTPRTSGIKPNIIHDKQKCNCQNVLHDSITKCQICDSLRTVCPTITKNNCLKCFSQSRKMSNSVIVNKAITRIQSPPKQIQKHKVIANSICPLNYRPPKTIFYNQRKPVVNKIRQIQPVPNRLSYTKESIILPVHNYQRPRTIVHQPRGVRNSSIRFIYESPYKDILHKTYSNPENLQNLIYEKKIKEGKQSRPVLYRKYQNESPLPKNNRLSNSVQS